MWTNSQALAAETLAHSIREVAKKAHTEEDLRIGVEQALTTALNLLGLTVTPRYEKTTLSGAADAVYGHVVIEYKRPGRLSRKGAPTELVQQIARGLPIIIW